MSELSPTGPPLPDEEHVYRAILYPLQWNAQMNMPSSAAFSDPVFSVDVASRSSPAETRGRFRDVLELVMFRCGTARELGFDSRDEPDPLHPDNHAHAHVYMTEYNALSGNRRKALAKRLCLICSRVNGD